MLDPLILLVNSFDVYLWRARAFALSGSHAELVGALRHLIAQLERRRATMPAPVWNKLTAMAADLARYIPADGELAAERSRLEAQLRN